MSQNYTTREQALELALRAIIIETMGSPPLQPYSIDSYLPPSIIDQAIEAINQVCNTVAITPPRIGEMWPEQGGLYAGIMRGEAGQPNYHLIVPTAPQASIKNIKWAEEYTNQSGAQSHADGLANTRYLCAAAISHPAAQWAANLVIDGHNDFYLPACHESRLAYINLPGIFETDDWYWTSTQHADSSDYAWVQGFDDGGQYNGRKSGEYRARAVRRLIIQ